MKQKKIISEKKKDSGKLVNQIFKIASIVKFLLKTLELSDPIKVLKHNTISIMKE